MVRIVRWQHFVWPFRPAGGSERGYLQVLVSVQLTEVSSGQWACVGIFLFTWKERQPADGKSSSRECVSLCRCKNCNWKSGWGKPAEKTWLTWDDITPTLSIHRIVLMNHFYTFANVNFERIKPAHTKRHTRHSKEKLMTSPIMASVKFKRNSKFNTSGEKKCAWSSVSESRLVVSHCMQTPLDAEKHKIFSCGNKTRKTDLAPRGF